MRPGIFRRYLARTCGVLAVVAATALGGTAAWAADPQSASAENPVPLSDEGLAGVLPGSSEGRFTYYSFVYPGDNSVATINMQVYPDNGDILSRAGFEVYGPKAGVLYVRSGSQASLMPNVSANLSTSDRGTYLVKVSNYNRDVPLSYTIWATGLPVQPTPAAGPTGTVPPVSAAPAASPAATPAPAPSPAATAALPTAIPAPAPAATQAPAASPVASPAEAASPESQDASGKLKGHLAAGTAGHFALYELTYPGDESVFTINLQVWPDNSALLANAGFRVYNPTGGLHITGGAQPGLSPNVTANLISRQRGTYVVQVYNYDPGIAMDYELTLVQGLPEGRKS